MADDTQRLKTIADGIEKTWQALRRAAANISGLLAIGRATCDEVRAYNLWALAIYNTQRGMLATLKANGEQGVPELPPAPTLFTWKGMSGADAWQVKCDGQPSSLNGIMKRALRGPGQATQYLSTNEVQIVTTDQHVFQPEQAPSYAELINLQHQREIEASSNQNLGLGVAWAVVILIAGISVGVGVAIAAIMHYLETSEIQEANVKQVQSQADAFAAYTAARLQCFQQCTGSGQSTETCVDHCKNIVDKPSILLPGQTGKWGMLQWIGFTVVAGAGTFAAVKLWQRHREGRPVFELPELHGAPQLGGGAETNEYGLRYIDWLRAAGYADHRSAPKGARKAWKGGDDPADWTPSAIAKYGPPWGLGAIAPGERVLPDPPSRSHGIQTKSEHQASIDVLRALSQTRQPDTSTILAWSPAMQDAFTRLSRAGYVTTDRDGRQWSRVRLTDAGKTYARQIDAI